MYKHNIYISMSTKKDSFVAWRNIVWNARKENPTKFIVDTKVPIWVDLATCVLKEWHKGTHVEFCMRIS